MPINKFQRQVLRLLADNRSPDSYVAGAAVINRQDNSSRYSNDIDIFHDPAVVVQQCSAIDIDHLKKHNLHVEVLLEQRGFVRCVVRSGADTLKLEWVSDTAFRFFPVIPDKDFGFRLHDVDAAVNKCLALANRTEARDVIDVLEIDKKILCLAACCWAACGKDPGFTPEFLLDCISRNARLTPELLAIENLAEHVNPKEIKMSWMKALKKAKEDITSYPTESLGCVFLNGRGDVVLDPKNFANLHPHKGSVKGSWPSVWKEQSY